MKAKVKIARVVFNPHQEIVYDDLTKNRLHNYRCGIYAHFCYEWDEMLIDENDPEFETCSCGMPDGRT